MRGFARALLLRVPQLLRKATQLGVLAFIVYTALGGIWRNYKVAHNHPRLVALIEGETWGSLYGLNEKALSLLGESDEVSYLFLGFPWGGRIFGLDTADPLMVASFLLQNGMVPSVLGSSLIVPLLLAMFFGKLFCSHLCPMRLTFELAQLVRAGLLRLHVPLPTLRMEQRLGPWILLGGLIAVSVAGTGVWFFILPYVALSTSLFLLAVGGGLSLLAAVVAFWLVVDVFLAPSFFCHNVCPTGFLLETAGRFSLFRLVKRGDEPCPSGCSLCQRACPYHLRPRDRAHRPACDNCGRCAMVCPSARLSRRLTTRHLTTRHLKVLAPVLLGAALLTPADALAHHNKGLPHYGYYENYPQVPVDEYIRVQGRWEIGATVFNFQGYDRRSAETPNDVKIFLYLYDLERERGYRGALDVEILRDGEVVSRFERLEVDQESIYSTRETLPASGEYELRAWIEGEAVTLPFRVDLLDDGLELWVALVFSVPILAIFTLAWLGRKRARLRVARGAHAARP